MYNENRRDFETIEKIAASCNINPFECFKAEILITHNVFGGSDEEALSEAFVNIKNLVNQASSGILYGEISIKGNTRLSKKIIHQNKAIIEISNINIRILYTGGNSIYLTVLFNLRNNNIFDDSILDDVRRFIGNGWLDLIPRILDSEDNNEFKLVTFDLVPNINAPQNCIDYIMDKFNLGGKRKVVRSGEK